MGAIQRYCVDSRQVRPGDCFVAIGGQRVDGHAYLSHAAQLGATSAWVSTTYEGPDFGLHLHRVNNPLIELQKLAQVKLKNSPARIIAVTGSVGKTTTKEFLRTLLAPVFRTAVTEGNQNSQLGLPLFVLNQLQGDEEVVVLEMGMSKRGELARLVSIAPPDIALLTAVSLAHAQNFSSLREIAAAKGEILSHPKTRIGIISADIEDLELLQATGSCRKETFSLRQLDSDWIAKELEPGLLQVRQPKDAPHLLGPLPITAPHFYHNLLGAVIVARNLGVSWEQIQASVTSLQLPPRRSERVVKGGVRFINDSYNAAPAAVVAALSSIELPSGEGRRIAVLGTMPELGAFSAACHREVGELALSTVDLLYCLGDETTAMQEIWLQRQREVFHFNDKDSLLRQLEADLQAEDVVLVKGANVLEMWEIIEQFQPRNVPQGVDL